MERQRRLLEGRQADGRRRALPTAAGRAGVLANVASPDGTWRLDGAGTWRSGCPPACACASQGEIVQFTYTHLELRPQALVKADGARPALGAVHHVGVAAGQSASRSGGLGRAEAARSGRLAPGHAPLRCKHTERGSRCEPSAVS